MMKISSTVTFRSLFLFFMLILFVSGLNAQVGTPSFYSAVPTTSTNAFPLNSTTSNKVQWMYAPGVFTTSGTVAGTPVGAGNLITKLYIRLQGVNATNVYSPDFTISMTQSGTSATFANATYLTGLTTVFSSSAFQFTGATTGCWYGINLTTPFAYDPTQSLIIEVKSNLSVSGGNTVNSITGTGSQRIYGAYAAVTGTAGAGLTPMGIDVISASPCTSPPVPGTLSASTLIACPNANFTININGGTVGGGQTYQWEWSATGLPGSYSILPGATIPFLTTSQVATTYYRCVITCGGISVPTNGIQITTPTTPLAGTYTINSAVATGGTNFQNFSDLAVQLNCVGISAPVTVNVAAATGPYNEQIDIGPIAGSSNVNTVTINGNGVTMTKDASTSPYFATLNLSGADYMTFNNLNLESTGAANAWGIHLMNQSDHNTFNNCTVTVNMTATATSTQGIVINGSNTTYNTAGQGGSDNLFNNCAVTGGYSGIYIYGSTTAPFVSDNSFLNCSVKDYYIYGCYNYYGQNGVISDCLFERPTRTTLTTFYGVFLTTGSLNMLVEKNRIRNPFATNITSTSTAYGIYSSIDAALGSENKYYNNLISDMNSNGTVGGIYLTGADYVQVYHNTISLDQTGATAGTTYGIYSTGTVGGIDIQNNNVSISRGGTGTKYCLYYGTVAGGGLQLSNFNNLYITTAATHNVGYWGTAYSTLSAWQAANTTNPWDMQSSGADPAYQNPPTYDYTPTALALNNVGTPLGIIKDITGANRSMTTPDIGAYEFTVSTTDIGILSLVSPVVAGCFSGTESITLQIKNFGLATVDFSINPCTITCVMTGTNTGTLTGSPTGTLTPGATMNVTLTGTVDMSAIGSYTFNAVAVTTGDINNGNDDLPVAATRTKVALVAGFVAANAPSFCVSGTPTLTLSGSVGGNVQWQESSVSATGPWTNVGTNALTYTPSTAITQDMHYQAEISCYSAPVATNAVSVAVNNPQLLSTTPGSICGNGPVTLSATASAGATPAWYSGAIGGTPLYSGNTYTTPPLSSTTTYYVEPLVGLGGADSAAVPIGFAITSGVYHHMFVVNSPTGLTLTGLGIKCNQAIGTLTAWDVYYRPDNYQTVPGANLSATGWTLLSSVTGVPSVGATDYTMIALGLGLVLPPASTYSFYVAPAAGVTHQYGTTAAGTTVASNANAAIIAGHRGSSLFNCTTAGGMAIVKLRYTLGCPGTRVPVIATVTPGPAFTISSSETLCNGVTNTMSVTSTVSDFDSYIWSPTTNLFTDAACTIPYTGTNVTTGIVYFNSTTAGTYSYSCTASNSTSPFCGGFATNVMTVQPTSATITGTSTNNCLSGSTTLSVSGLSTGIQWQNYVASAWTNISAATAPTYATGTQTSTIDYRVDVLNSLGASCFQTTPFTFTINNPQLLSTTPGAVCGSGPVTLGATVSAGSTANWYTAATGGSPIATGTSYTTPIIGTTTNYYVSASSGGFSANMGKVLLEPSAATGGGLTTYVVFDAITNFTIVSVDLFPYGATDNVPGTVTIELRNSAGTPIMSQIVNVIAHNSVALSVPQTVFLNFPVTPGTGYRLGVNAWTGGVTNLYRDATGFTYPYTVPGVASITGMSLAGYYYFFYNWLISTGCETARSMVTASVTTGPTLTLSANQVVCNNAPATFSVTSTLSNFDDYIWTPATDLYTDAACTIPYVANTSATTVYAKTSTAGTITYTCSALNTTTSCVGVGNVSLTVLPASASVTASAAVCQSGVNTLSLSPATGYPTGTIQWQSSPDNITYTNIIGANTASYTSPTITTNTYYKALISDGSSNLCLQPYDTALVNTPTIVNSTPATICGTGVANLTATGTGVGTVKWYNLITGGSPIASGNSYSPTVSATTTYYAEELIGGTGGTPLLITEADLGTVNDQLEIMNVSSSPLNVTGWKVAISNSYTVINSVNAVVQTLSGTLAPGATLSWTDLATAPNYWGSNMFWNPGAFPGFAGWAAILDNNNNLVDIVFWNWPSADIQAASITIGTATITVGSQWVGNGINATTVANTQSLSRQGNIDNNTLSDFSIINLSMGALNPGMTIPFQGLGCASTPRTPIIATVNPAPALTLSSSTSAICIGATSSLITVTAPNPTSDYDTYSWSPNTGVSGTAATGYTFNPTSSTSYTLYANQTSGALCQNSTPLAIVVNPLPSVTAAASASPICDGQSTNLSCTATASFNFDWTSSPAGFTSNVQNPGAVSPAVNTSYYVLVTDPATTCTNADTVSVLVTPRPTSVVSGGATICNGSSTPVSVALTGTAPWSFTYSDGTTSNVVNTSANPYLIAATTGGTYTITALSDADCNSLPADRTGSAIVVVTPRPTSVVSGGGTVCSGSPLPDVTITLTGTGPWNFTYTDGTTSTPITGNTINPYIIAGAGIGTYTVTALNDANCTSLPADITGSASVSVTPSVGAVSFSMGTSSTRCQGAATITYSASASNTSGITYTLDAASLTGLNTIDANTGAVMFDASWFGTTIITANAAGCSGPTTATHTVTIDATPSVVNAGPNQTSCGAAIVTMSPTSPSIGTGAWSGGNGTWSGNDYTPSLGEATTGAVITATWTVTNGTCSATSTATITIDGAVSANAGANQTSCGSAVVTMSPTAPSIGTGVWAGGAGTWSGNDYTPGSGEASAGAVITATWTVTNGTCSATSTAIITISGAVSANAGANQTSCGSAVVTMSPTAPSIGTGVWTGGAGTWSGNDYTPSSGEATAGASITATWTVTNGTCSATSTASITISGAVSANAGANQTSCGSVVVTMSPTAPSIGTGVWTGGAGTWSGNDYTPNITEATAGASITATWTVTNGTCVATSTASITINGAVSANAGANQTSCGAAIVTMSPTSPSIGTGAWSGGNGTWSGNDYTPSAGEAAAGATITATWTVTNGTCIQTATATITINVVPATLTTSVTPSCGSTSLAVTSPITGTLEWRDNSNPTLGTVVSTANPYVLTTAGTYYAFDKSGLGCYSLAAAQSTGAIQTIPMGVALPGTGLHTANTECTDATGWTHYWEDPTPASANSGDEILLLSIDKTNYTGAGLGILGSSLQIQVSAATGYSTIQPDIAPPLNYANQPWPVMNRHWKVNPLNEPNPGDMLPVRFYYTMTDYMQIPGVTSPIDLDFYKVNDVVTNYNVDPTSGHQDIPLATSYAADGFWLYQHASNATINTWTGGSHGAHFYADMIVGHFGGGGGGSPAGPLPINLLSFTGHNEGVVNILNWETSSEINAARFDIYRSTDNKLYEKMGEKAAIGSPVQGASYEFVDAKPIVGINYYQLKLVDVDGTLANSNIVEIMVSPNFNYTIYPNPMKDKLNVELRGVKGVTKFSLYNSLGQEIMTDKWKDTDPNLHQLDISSLAKGIYYYELSNQDQKYSGKVVKE